MSDRRENFPRLLDCLLARKRTVADQNTDVIHPHCAECSSLSRSRNFVDLDDHAANLKIAADCPAKMKRAREFSCSRAVALFPRIHRAHPRCRRQHQMRLNRLRQRLARPGSPPFTDRSCVAFHVHFLQPFNAGSHNIFRFLPGRFEQRP